jgi:Domain of unknown function (DUF4149)
MIGWNHSASIVRASGLKPKASPTMNAIALLALFDTLYLVALSALIGSSLFLVFGLKPFIFEVLEKEAAARLWRGILPRFYVWGATAGAIALAALVCGSLSVPELRGYRVAAQAGLLLASTLLMLYGGNSLTPAMNVACNHGPSGRPQLERLLRRSGELNLIVVVCGLLLLGGFATRPAPTTVGIVEPSPVERSILNEQQYQRILDKARQPSSRPLGDYPLPAAPGGSNRR